MCFTVQAPAALAKGEPPEGILIFRSREYCEILYHLAARQVVTALLSGVGNLGRYGPGRDGKIPHHYRGARHEGFNRA